MQDPVIIVSGDPTTGFRHFGPVEREWASNVDHYAIEDIAGRQDPWWIVDITPVEVSS